MDFTRRERLLTSFEIVNGHFKRLFVELFGGGEAALHLIESDDPLEAGLEIIAKPPGKKPQTLSLLSGGEQALTALALIFAVFLTNPSMARMNRLYGVTMAERGVSQLVSVALDEAVKILDQHVA